MIISNDFYIHSCICNFPVVFEVLQDSNPPPPKIQTFQVFSRKEKKNSINSRTQEWLKFRGGSGIFVRRGCTNLNWRNWKFPKRHHFYFLIIICPIFRVKYTSCCKTKTCHLKLVTWLLWPLFQTITLAFCRACQPIPFSGWTISCKNHV